MNNLEELDKLKTLPGKTFKVGIIERRLISVAWSGGSIDEATITFQSNAFGTPTVTTKKLWDGWVKDAELVPDFISTNE